MQLLGVDISGGSITYLLMHVSVRSVKMGMQKHMSGAECQSSSPPRNVISVKLVG